ncbi:MAG: hypothetical protein PVJ80_04155 [Gemmatimonadota bacterium]
MLKRTAFGLMGVVIFGAAGAAPARAQVSGRVVLASGPIGVSVVFGSEGARRVEHRRRVARVVRYEAPVPVRYRRGMSLAELELYRGWIEREYDVYRHMHPDDAYYYFGWSRGELRDYVRWLRDERHFLRDEHKRLERLYRAQYRYDDRPGHGHGNGKGRGRGRGRGVARGNPHR